MLFVYYHNLLCIREFRNSELGGGPCLESRLQAAARQGGVGPDGPFVGLRAAPPEKDGDPTSRHRLKKRSRNRNRHRAPVGFNGRLFNIQSKTSSQN